MPSVPPTTPSKNHMTHPSTPDVSVLMAVYNTDRYLDASIRSVLQQTAVSLELIIVDDCSTDNSPAIIDAWAQQDARVVAIHSQQNGGASAALNQGLAVARGRYLTRQDSDDISLPERLAEQLHFLEQHPQVGTVGTAVILIDPQDNPIQTQTFLSDDAHIQEALPDTMCFCGPTVLTRRSCLEAANFSFDERLSGSEDYDFCLRLAEVGQMANLTRPLYQYRQHSASVSRQQRYQQMQRKALALEGAMQRRFAADPPPRYIALLGRDYLRTAVLAYSVGEKAVAETAVQQALAIAPTLFDQPHPLNEILRHYTPRDSVEQALAFSQALFDELLPPTRPLAKLRADWLAQLHIDELFAGMANNQPQRIQAHLGPAIHYQPRWLLNRGVLAQWIKQRFRLNQKRDA